MVMLRLFTIHSDFSNGTPRRKGRNTALCAESSAEEFWSSGQWTPTPSVGIRQALRQRFKTAIENIAAERSYYDVKLGEAKFSFEGSLSELEDKVERPIEKIIAAESLAAINAQEKAWIATFIAGQYARVPNQRRMIADVKAALKQRVVAMGRDRNDPSIIEYFGTDEHTKAHSILFITDTIRALLPIIERKTWMLLKDPLAGFWIGDCPIALYNHEDLGPYGNIGFAVPFVEIYLPLSSKISLGLWGSEFVDRLVAANVSMTTFKHNFDGRFARARPPRIDDIDRHLAEASRVLPNNAIVLDAIKNGTPLVCTKENVEYQNSLQGLWSNRYVMSGSNNFDLLQRMIRERPDVRYGKRITTD
jgi:hypothetical protein